MAAKNTCEETQQNTLFSSVFGIFDLLWISVVPVVSVK